MSITSDLFRDTEKLETDYSMLINKITEVCDKMEILPTDIFIKKCQQLYETLLVRHGLMLVGQTFSGKSKVIAALKNALTALDGQEDFYKTVTYSLNPKAVNSFQLYGKLDPDTKLWTDGVLPQIMRYCEDHADEEERKWIVFDGPVDAVWIENMNTVLDDNKILCLTNGQKIKVTNWMNLMFEVEDLINASPATVSRCGMVYLEPEQLGWEPLLKAYLKYKLPENFKQLEAMIWKRMDFYLTPMLVYAQKRCKLPFKIDEMQMTDAVIKIFHSCCMWHKEQEEPITEKQGKPIVDNYSLFATFWGIGGVLEEQSRKDFHAFVMKMIYYEDVTEIYNLDLNGREWKPNGIPYNFGEKIDSIYSLVFDNQSSEWMPWIKTVPRWVPPKDETTQYSEIIVPTSDTIRNDFFLKLMLENKNHILLTGPTGTAKTVGAITLINKDYNSQSIGNIQTVFSGQTYAN
jgi:dynein heavy chain